MACPNQVRSQRGEGGGNFQFNANFEGGAEVRAYLFEFSIEIVVMLLISMLVIFASWYDMEKSSDMKNLPHSDYIAYRRSKGRGGFGDGLTRLRRSVFGRILKCFRADEAKELSAPADSRQDVLQTNNAAAHDHAPAIATNPKMAMGLRLAHSDLVQLAPTAGYAGHI